MVTSRGKGPYLVVTDTDGVDFSGEAILRNLPIELLSKLSQSNLLKLMMKLSGRLMI